MRHGRSRFSPLGFEFVSHFEFPPPALFMASSTTAPVRFGLIGYGLFGVHHAAAIAKTPGAQLAAIAVKSDASQAAARTAHPDCHVCGDWRALLARGDVDVIDVVVPNRLHYEIGRAALESGKHVLMEKPLAIERAHCNELARL